MMDMKPAIALATLLGVANLASVPANAASVTYLMNQSNLSTLPDGTDYSECHD